MLQASAAWDLMIEQITSLAVGAYFYGNVGAGNGAHHAAHAARRINHDGVEVAFDVQLLRQVQYALRAGFNAQLAAFAAVFLNSYPRHIDSLDIDYQAVFG